MAVAILSRDTLQIGGGNDSIVIIKALGEIPGGRVLDTSAFTDTNVIRAGHVIYKDSAGEYKPLEVTDGAYAAIPDGATLVGVLKKSTLVNDGGAAIVTIGQVLNGALPYAVTDEIKTALPLIQFI